MQLISGSHCAHGGGGAIGSCTIARGHFCQISVSLIGDILPKSAINVIVWSFPFITFVITVSMIVTSFAKKYSNVWYNCFVENQCKIPFCWLYIWSYIFVDIWHPHHLCHQVSDIPGVVHVLEHFDLGRTFAIVLESSPHIKVTPMNIINLTLAGVFMCG